MRYGKRALVMLPAANVADFLCMSLEEAKFALDNGYQATVQCGQVAALAAMMGATVEVTA